MNDDDIATLGGFCMEVLGDHRFEALRSLYDQQCAADFFGTKPEHKEARERIYHERNGVASFLGLMEKFAETFDKLTQPPVPQDQMQVEDDPSVHDIYEN